MSSSYPVIEGAQPRFCLRCKAVLPAHAIHCGNCGYHNPPSIGSNPPSLSGNPPSWPGNNPPSLGGNPSSPGNNSPSWPGNNPPSLGGNPPARPAQFLANPASWSGITPPAPQGTNSSPQWGQAPVSQPQSAFPPPPASPARTFDQQPGANNYLSPTAPLQPGSQPSSTRLSQFAPSPLPTTGTAPQQSARLSQFAPPSQPALPVEPANTNGQFPPASPALPREAAPPSWPGLSNSSPSQQRLETTAPSQPGTPNYFNAPTQSLSNGSSAAPTQTSWANTLPPPAQNTSGLVVPQPALNDSMPSSGEKLSQTRKGSNKAFMIGVIVLVIALIGSVGYAGYTFFMPHNKPRPITSNPPNIPVPKATPMFADTFNNNDQQWDLPTQQGKYSVAVGNGTLILEDDDKKLLPEFLPGNRTFSDFKVMVDAVLSKGDQTNGYGLYIRSTPDQNGNIVTYYRIELYGDGSYAVFKGTEGTSSPNAAPAQLVDYTASSAIQPKGGINHMMVTARGSSITLMVNGQVLKTFSDTSYAKGQLALFVSNLQDAHAGAQATFSHLVIYQPDAK